MQQSRPTYELFRFYAFTLFEDLGGSLKDISIIVGIIAIYQFAILQTVPDNLPEIVTGLMMVALGLALFLRGLETGIFPLGEDLSQRLAQLSTRRWLLVFAFVIGFATTIAEPALIAIAHKAAVISDGQIDAFALRVVVALSVGSAIVLGVVRILLDHPIHWYIMVGYLPGVCWSTHVFAGRDRGAGLRLRWYYDIDCDGTADRGVRA